MSLENIDLTPEETQELREQLESWKEGVINKVEEELTSKYEEMESALKEEYESLVQDIREKMKRVYTKRFVTALKEMYEQIKAEVLAESFDSPEMRVLDEIKTLVYPLIKGSEGERYASEFAKMAEMNEELSEELELTKGQKKLMELTEGLSEDVKRVVVALVGDGTEEEVVERYAAIKEALDDKKSDDDEEDVDYDEEPEEEEEEEEEKSSKKKKKKSKKNVKKGEDEEPEMAEEEIEEDEDEDEPEEPEDENESIKLQSKTGNVEPLVEEEEQTEYNETLKELLELAGVSKEEK